MYIFTYEHTYVHIHVYSPVATARVAFDTGALSPVYPYMYMQINIYTAVYIYI